MQTPASDRHTNSSKMSMDSSYSILETLSSVLSPIEHERIKEELEKNSTSTLPNVATGLSKARKEFDIVNGKKRRNSTDTRVIESKKARRRARRNANLARVNTKQREYRAKNVKELNAHQREYIGQGMRMN